MQPEHKKNAKQIVFVETSPTIYSYKIAKALKNRGYEVILISLLNFEKDFFKSAYNRMFCLDLPAFTLNFNNIKFSLKTIFSSFKKILKIKLLKPYAIIATANPYPLWLPALIKIFTKAPFIFFPYDVNIIKYSDIESYKKIGVWKFELLAEKYLFDKADAILLKGGEEKIIKEKVPVGGEMLFFPPYCSNEFLVNLNRYKLSKKDKELHLVFMGYVTGDKKLESSLGMDSLKSFIKQIITQKIHFHVYPTNFDFVNNSLEYKEIRENPYFHVHVPVGAKEIVKEISKYDFGCWITSLDTRLIDPRYLNTTMGNKFSTFLEAGIPFVYTLDHETINEVLEDYDLNIGIETNNLKNLKKHLKSLNYKTLLKKVVIMRRDFNIDKKILRLEALFDRLNLKK